MYIAALFNRGEAWSAKREWQKAICDYDKVIQLVEGTDQAFALNSRGLAFAAIGKRNSAFADFNEAIRLDPKSAFLFISRANLWNDQEWEKAVRDYTEAIRLDPTNASAICNRGLIWGKKQKWEQATTDFTQALKVNPKFAPALFSRGVVWAKTEEWGKALSDFNEVLQSDPKYEEARLSRGVLLHKLGEWKKAIEDYDTLLQQNPKHVTALAERAVILATCPDAKHRDGKKAVVDAQKACELAAWKVPYHLSVLGMAFAETGDFAKSLKCEDIALKDTDYAKNGGERAKLLLKTYEAKRPIRLEAAIPPEKRP